MSVQEAVLRTTSVTPVTVTAAQEAAPKCVNPTNTYVYRAYFGQYKGTLVYRLNWNIIQKNSHIFVSATEGYMGAASYTIHNIDPQDGYVLVRLTVDGSSPSDVYIDYLVMNI